MRPFERLNMDILGPKPEAQGTGARFLLVIIDEYSRFPFAFALKEITFQSTSIHYMYSIFLGHLASYTLIEENHLCRKK